MSETPIPPVWLRWFINDVARALHATALPPLGCHFFFNTDLEQWEITIFPSSTELVGGAMDGIEFVSALEVDVTQLICLFDKPPMIGCRFAGAVPEDELGTNLQLEGITRGYNVWLRVLSESPASISAGRQFNTYTLELEDLW